MKPESVLITGGSGLVGRYLTSLLLSEGYKVSHLSRNHNYSQKVRVFRWNPEKNYIDPLALEGTDYVVHLAGANIGEKRWTESRKKVITDSRVNSARLLHLAFDGNQIPLKAFISASAIGYYGSVTSDKIFREDDQACSDFTGTTCRLWEEAADLFRDAGIRTVKIRTGVVLEKSDGVLSKMAGPARLGLFPRLGKGRQYMPWIHIADLCYIYLKAITDPKMEGPYNAVSPEYTDNITFMKTLAGVMKKPAFSPRIPGFFLKLAMGKSSEMALMGSRISPERIINSGYRFHFPELSLALKDSLGAH